MRGLWKEEGGERLLRRARRRCCGLGVAGWVGGGAGDEAQEGGVTDQPVEEEGAGGGDVPCWYR